MDNRNDFIHIDEVFKRLKDKEEPEPSGAWLRMQELLNEEMPVGAPAAGSMLRKYMMPLVALLLLGGGVAYYKLSSNHVKDVQNTSFANGNHLSDKNSHVSSAAPLNDNSQNTNNPSSGPQGNHPIANNNHSNHSSTSAAHVAASANGKNINDRHFASGNNHHSGKATTNNNSVSNTAENVAAHGVHKNNGASSLSNKRTSTNSIAQNEVRKEDQKNVAGANHALASTANTANKTATPTVAQNGNKAAKTNEAGNKTANQFAAEKQMTKSANANTNASANPVAIEEQNVVEQIYPSSSNGNTGGASTASTLPTTSTKHSGKSNHSGASTTANGMNVVASNWNNDKIVKDKNGSYYKEVRDTFKKIDMLEHAVASNVTGTRKFSNVIDTLAITRVERIKYMPLAPLEMAALREAKIIPQATFASSIPMNTRPKEYTVTNEMVNLVPLANYKVNSRKVDPSKFNQLMHSTTQGISNYFDGTNKFYAAILLGGNAFMGNPGAFGMQFGIAGLYQLSERLTLGAEIKFANHYFSNYTINDQSVNYGNISSEQVSGVEWLFKGTQTTTTSVYKINSFSELQFPITLNYSFGRLSVLGGLNMAYAFPVKWNKASTLNIEDVSSTQTSTTNPFLDADFKMNEQKDFDSRFGIGYVGGLSYDLSRKISLDARVTQNLWSSYNGNADNVSKLFKTPTFQFSISYFFGRKERVVYIMDKR